MSKINAWPKGRNAEYLDIIEKVDAAGACSDGVEHMLQYDDFYTMFMEIPDPGWPFWLMQNVSASCEEKAFPVSAQRNAIMVFLNDAEHLFAARGAVRYAKNAPWSRNRESWDILGQNEEFGNALSTERHALAYALDCDPESMLSCVVDFAGMPQCWLKHWHEFLRNINVDVIYSAWASKRSNGREKRFSIKGSRVLQPYKYY